MESIQDPSMEDCEATKSHKHKALISKLENDSGNWLSPKYTLYKYQNFWYSWVYLEGVLGAQEMDPKEFNLSPSDIIICSTIKSGTTWLKAIVFSIVTRTRFDPFSVNHPLCGALPHDLIPYIELDVVRYQTPRDPDLPLLSTHMPYSALPDSIQSMGCKIVYICRNPKDVLVSMFHFAQKFAKEDNPLCLEKMCDLFCKGVSMYGSYWDHVLEYWKASLDNPQKVMFLKYEDMMVDTEFYVKDLARFMGSPFSKEEVEEGVVKRIVEICGFENLSALEVNKTGIHRAKPQKGEDRSMPNSVFFRKGKVNDWKNYLSEDMATKIDQITDEKFGDFGLTL